MKERPILFSGPMVAAILQDRKTQTRRVVNPQPSAGVRGSLFAPSGVEDGHGRQIPWRYGEPPDQLWVRETWTPGVIIEGRGAGNSFVRFPDGAQKYRDGAYYRPENYVPGEFKPELYKWKPSIHMPRWASRIQLEITEARIERLHDISEADCCAEGVGSPITRDCKRPKFQALWESINGAESWASNPWVYVTTFRRIRP